jgi:AmmeMemoRadiSam system protein B
MQLARAEVDRMRTPAVSGRFYPENPDELHDMVERFLAPPAPEVRPAVALMAPHAGFVYSGMVAGDTYRRVEVPARVVLMGPNHTGLGPPLSLWDAEDWAMPWGHVAVDPDLCASLKRHCAPLVSDRQAHRREHCLEVQLPFLWARRPGVRIAAIVVGTSALEDLRELGRGLAAAVSRSPDPILIVISSDMTHYETADAAARKDRRALEAMERLDAENLHRRVREERISMCGFAPAVAGLVAARDLGARSGKVARYSHSGDVTGDLDSVVGYAGMVFS